MLYRTVMYKNIICYTIYNHIIFCPINIPFENFMFKKKHILCHISRLDKQQNIDVEKNISQIFNIFIAVYNKNVQLT